MSCSRARLFLLRASPKKHSESRNRVSVPESVLYRPESRPQFVYELNKGATGPGRQPFAGPFAQGFPEVETGEMLLAFCFRPPSFRSRFSFNVLIQYRVRIG